MAKELIARNTLQLHGENPPNSIYLDSRPVIASPSVEKTQCLCWREISGRTWKSSFFWGCLISFYSIDESVLCGLKPSLLVSLPCSLACKYLQRLLLLLVAQVALNMAADTLTWTSKLRGLGKLPALALTKENCKNYCLLIISLNDFLAVSEDKFAPELCIDLTLPSYVVCSSASTLLFASSFKNSDACLDSTNPLLLKLSFRGRPDVRYVATHPKELK